MKKSAMVAVLVVGMLLVAVVPSYAWVRVWVGPPVPFWYGPRYYVVAPAPVIVTPPAVVESPPVYTQAEPAQGYWYFCPSSQGYYPNVQTCSAAWVKVPPRER